MRSDNEVHYYANDSLLYRGKIVLPAFAAEDKTSASRGRWLFFNAAGTKQSLVVQADSSSGIVNDYGLVTVDCTGATVSLTPSTFDAAGAGGQVSLTVTGSAGCVWTAHSDVDWLQTTSTGVGDGTILVNVRANTTSSPRRAAITVGGASATISQDPAAPGTVNPPPSISSLPFRVTDAEFSKPLDAIVAVSEVLPSHLQDECALGDDHLPRVRSLLRRRVAGRDVRGGRPQRFNHVRRSRERHGREEARRVDRRP